MSRESRNCLRSAEKFTGSEIVNTLCTELRRSHRQLAIGIYEPPNRRDFFVEYSFRQNLQPLVRERSWRNKHSTMAQCKENLERLEGERSPVGLMLCTGKLHHTIEIARGRLALQKGEGLL
jgi:hypothetical protein